MSGPTMQLVFGQGHEDHTGHWPSLPHSRNFDWGLTWDTLIDLHEKQDELAQGRETRLYVVREPTGFLKIGVAEDPVARWKSLQVANPYPLELLGSVAATVRLERFIHAAFWRERIRGEWFEPSRRLLQFLELLETANHFYRLIESDGDVADVRDVIASLVSAIDHVLYWREHVEAA